MLVVQSDDQRTYNMSTTDEIGVILLGDGFDVSVSGRDIMIKKFSGELQCTRVIISATTARYNFLSGWMLRMSQEHAIEGL